MNLHRTQLQRVDRCSMAFNVETRVPFLDGEVVQLALSIEHDWKVKDNVEKWCEKKHLNTNQTTLSNVIKILYLTKSGLHSLGEIV